MIRIEMLHEDEGHAGIGRQILQQLGERLQAAGGCADADYGERHAMRPPRGGGGTGGGRLLFIEATLHPEFEVFPVVWHAFSGGQGPLSGYENDIWRQVDWPIGPS